MQKEIKKRARKKAKVTTSFIIYYVVPAVALLLLGGIGLVKAITKTHVLGLSTGPVLLADHGSNDSGDGTSGGGDSNSSSGGSEGSKASSFGSGGNFGGSTSSGQGNTGSGGRDIYPTGSPDGGTTTQNNLPDNTQVDCIGPDGKHFTTTFHACKDLNDAWHKDNFSFTQLSVSAQKPETEKKDLNTQQNQSDTENKTDHLVVKTEEGNKEILLGTSRAKLELKIEDGKTVVQAKTSDGTEVNLEQKDAFSKINEMLSGEDVKVSTAAGKIAIRKAEVEATTDLPISINPVTKELTVTTPKGEKTVTVLPDQAVEALLKNNVLTSIMSSVSSDSGTFTEKAVLTEVNNQPVFAVQGVSEKKILGFIPVGFSKTAIVSAQTGKLIVIQESLLNRLLETISF